MSLIQLLISILLVFCILKEVFSSKHLRALDSDTAACSDGSTCQACDEVRYCYEECRRLMRNLRPLQNCYFHVVHCCWISPRIINFWGLFRILLPRNQKCSILSDMASGQHLCPLISLHKHDMSLKITQARLVRATWGLPLHQTLSVNI